MMHPKEYLNGADLKLRSHNIRLFGSSHSSSQQYITYLPLYLPGIGETG